MSGLSHSASGEYKRKEAHVKCAGCGAETYSKTGFCTFNAECKRMSHNEWYRQSGRASSRKHKRTDRISGDMLGILSPLSGLSVVERDRRLNLVRKIKEHRAAMEIRMNTVLR